MDGIYKITAGHWSSNGELIEDDIDYYAHQGVIDSKQVQDCDTIEIPVIGVGDQVPPSGTIAYLVGVPGVPNGIYTITRDDKDASSGVTGNSGYHEGVSLGGEIVIPTLVTDSYGMPANPGTVLFLKGQVGLDDGMYEVWRSPTPHSLQDVIDIAPFAAKYKSDGMIVGN